MKKVNEWIVFTQMETTNINTSCFKSNVYYSFGQLIKKCQSPSWNLKHFPLHKRFSFILSLCVNYFFVFYFCRLCFHCSHHLPCFSSMSLRGALFTHARQLMQTSHIWTAEQCAKYWHTNTCKPFMERSHTRIFWFYLAALLPSHAPLPASRTHSTSVMILHTG